MLVDTNVLIDVLNNEPQWADWSIHQLRVQSKIHVLTINPIIYAELSCTFKKVEDLDEVLLDIFGLPLEASNEEILEALLSRYAGMVK